MSANKFFESLDITSRRSFLKIAALAGVSSSVLFAPASSMAAYGKAAETLNVALGLEFEAISAYSAGAGLLEGAVLDLAKGFLANHQQHRDALIATINKIGGKPIPEPKFDAGKTLAKVGLKDLTKDNVLQLAAALERGATQAYLGVIPQLEKLEIAQAAAKIAADEATHTAILEHALKTYKGKSFLG